MASAALGAQGIHVASVTYDEQDTLRAFGEAYQITYPLLSDTGSEVIRSFGIFNTNIPEDHMMYGMPWPGDYLVASDGHVRDKLFLPDYQLRPSATEVVLRHGGDAVKGNGVEIAADTLKATVKLSTDRCFPEQVHAEHEARKHLRFPLEPRQPIRIGRKRFRQDLQRHLAVQLGVGGLIDLAHAAFADLRGDVVAPYALESHWIRPETEEVIASSAARA